MLVLYFDTVFWVQLIIAKVSPSPSWLIATLDLEERPILEDGLSGLIKSDLTNRPPTPTHPPTHPVQMDC